MFGPDEFEYKSARPALLKPNGEVRIFVLGGSTVSEGNPPFPALLEKSLQKKNKNIHIFNYGVVSQNSSQELIRVVKEVSDLSPDLIVLYDGGNDIMDPYYWDPRPGYTYNFMAYENNPIFNPEIKSYPLWSMIGLGSRLIRLMFFEYYQNEFFGLKALRQSHGYMTVEWMNRVAKTYVSNHIKTQLFAKALRAQSLSIFQPMLFYKNRLSVEESHLSANDKNAKDYALSLRQLVLNEAQNHLKTDPNFNFEDLSDAFVDTEVSVFGDYIHPNQAGIEKLAILIEEKINPFLENLEK